MPLVDYADRWPPIPDEPKKSRLLVTSNSRALGELAPALWALVKTNFVGYLPWTAFAMLIAPIVSRALLRLQAKPQIHPFSKKTQAPKRL